jgi:hypothetical protein
VELESYGGEGRFATEGGSGKRRSETVLSKDNGCRDYSYTPHASSSKELVSGFPLKG